MIHLVIYAIGAVIAAAIGASLSNDVRQRVARWLRQHGLAKSVLMDAVVLLDKADSGIRARVRVTARNRPSEVLSIEKTYRYDQITDPQLRAELNQRGHAEQNVLALVSTA
jgi:hypothetical protein